MKKSVVVLFLSLILSLAVNADTDKVLNKIEWLGQASVKLDYLGKTIYIDPFELKVDKKADFIFITHHHRDHLSVADVKKISTEKTVIVVAEYCADKLKGIKAGKIVKVNPGSKGTFGKIGFEAVHAYNIKRVKYHPKSMNCVGFVVNLDGVKLYHAGDTELIPEMKNIDCDIAMLPMGPNFTMTCVEDAVKAAHDVKAEVAIPAHYGRAEGTVEDAQKFKKLLEGKIKVVILKY